MNSQEALKVQTFLRGKLGNPGIALRPGRMIFPKIRQKSPSMVSLSAYFQGYRGWRDLLSPAMDNH